ncbi:hypothetical protein N2W54_002420 [Lotmaria passim]
MWKRWQRCEESGLVHFWQLERAPQIFRWCDFDAQRHHMASQALRQHRQDVVTCAVDIQHQRQLAPICPPQR